ncbi:MAG: aminoglycoside phosphotransferase family protein [Rikenellaceae bacterium]
MELIDIARNFRFAGEPKDVTPLGQGFINDTFIVTVNGSDERYILQRKNKNIFTDVPAMMDNIERVCEHIRYKVANPRRESMTIIRTNSGELYCIDDAGEYWAACLLIEPTVAYDSANSPEIAYQGGKGIGLFQKMLCDFDGELADILPGFHNMRFRFDQWDTAIREDKAGRVSALSEEITWIESRRDEMLAFYALIEDGSIPKRVSHNDTKINNILFDEQGEVVCVIDLDTVLSSTVLNDFGDAIRTYANSGAEDDENLDNVSLSLEMFKGYTQGYLSQTNSFLNDCEKAHLAFSARFIIFEQVLRFLMDYINGDTYYKIASEHHNLIRTRAQYKLLLSAEEQYDEMLKIINDIL